MCRNVSGKEIMTIPDYSGDLNALVSDDKEPVSDLEQTMLDIREARSFIRSRMNLLENKLPPRPIVVARELVDSI